MTINNNSARRVLARKFALALLAGTSAAAINFAASAQTNVTVPTTYTPGTLNNNGSASYEVGSGTVNMSGKTNFTGATGVNQITYSPHDAYVAGYLTGPSDPNTKWAISLGARSNGVPVFDPITNGNIIVGTYVSSGITQTAAGNNGAYTIFSPTAPGQGPFIEATIASVSGGGILNVDFTGNVGSSTAKQTSYVMVTNGTANWNSANTVLFSASNAYVTPESVVPKNVNLSGSTYNGTFTVNTTDGAQVQNVTDLASFQAYNTWLISQLQAGKLGLGPGAQTAYNNALGLAFTVSNTVYSLNPVGGTISPTDPLFVEPGVQAAMQANGVNATARVGTTGAIVVSTGRGLTANAGGTVINDGVITSYNTAYGIVAEGGGHAINNGIRYVGQASGVRGEGRADNVSGAGSTYQNTGIINVAGWNTSSISSNRNVGLQTSSAGFASNDGTINVATTTMTGNAVAYGAYALDTGTFTNNAAGVIYISREASADLSLAPFARGGADVVQVAGAYGIVANGTGAVRNAGAIVIGDKVQGSSAISVGVAAGANVISSGSITVNGHYSATPLQNIGILTYATSGTVENSGTIDLLGVNVVGIKTATAGAKASSSGTINVAGGADLASGVRNYGVWSDGVNSLVTISGKVNLVGDGAIGVHARNKGGVAISGNGEVVFQSGTNQIGYFVYGPGASVTNTGTGAQNVLTESSVLFRLEDGADFTGSAGASSTLTASGKNSTAVVVTGLTGTDVSAFNSGGMTINTTGKNAVAVLVEGGAQGKISSAATINLTGVGAIAGIVDGQKHALDGSISGTPIAGVLSNAALNAGAAGFGTGTILVAGANLNSALDEVTGYIARNTASLSNSGNIVFTGAHTTGIQVLEGSTGGNSGSITIERGSVGLVAASTGAATVLNNTGSLILKGGSNTDRTVGISATGSAVTVNMSAGSIDMQGQGAIGVRAVDGAKVNLSGASSVSYAAEASGVTDQIAFLLSGAGSTINTNTSGAGLVASGKNSTLIRLENGAVQSGVLTMGATGTGSRGLWATGVGTKVTALSGSVFDVGGAGAQAVLVQGAAQVEFKAGTVINLTGTNTIVGTVDGNEYKIDGTTVNASNTGSKLISEATLNSSTAGATGFITQNAGTLINSGDITFAGANSAAIKVINGNFTNQSGNITANGVAVDVTGANSTVDVQGGQVKASNGTAAIRLGTGASLNLVGSGLGTVTASGTAHAVLIDTGATGLVIDGAHIDMSGAGSTGNGVENKAEISGIQLTNTTVIDVMNGKGIRTAATLATTNAGTVNVKGSGVGLAFETATGTAMGNNIDFSTSNALNVNVTGANGTGISVKHTGNGIVKNGANVNVAAVGGSAVVLAGVATFENTGNLISTSTTAPIVALGVTKSVTNSGEIRAASATTAALTFDAQNSTLTNSGKITGVVDLGAGVNTATNAAGAILTGNLISATGTNTVTNSGTIVGDIVLGNGVNTTTLNAGSTVTNVTGGTGTNSVTVKGNAVFTSLDGGIGGAADTLTFDGSTRTLTAATAIDHYETMKLVNGSVITTADLIKMTDTAGGVGAISIDGTSTLAITAPAGYNLNHALTGTGTISAKMASATAAFNFGAGAGNAFAGMVQMGTGTLALSGDNTRALTAATLRVDTGSTTTVGTGNQAIGGLNFNGGTVIFDATAPAQIVASSTITAGKLDIAGTGTVKVTIPTGFDNTQPLPNTQMSLLQQDDATAMTKLVGSANVTGTAGALTLVDQTGAAITNAKLLDINQGGTKVAEGTYDYKLLSSSNGVTSDGLYVGYGLKTVNLIGTGTNALVLTPAGGATGLATDLSAKVIGTGDLAVMAGAGKTVSLSNTLNSYTGATGVVTGTLKMGADNVLGKTSSLNVAATAAFDTAGYNQSVGAVNTALGGKVTIATGSTLTIVDTQRTAGSTVGGTLRGNTLFGAGTFVIDPSVVLVDGAQAGYTGQLNVTAGSQLVLNTANAFDNALGVALVGATDKLTFGNLSTLGDTATITATGTAAVKLSGLGTVETRDLSDVTLAADNTTFAGKFDVGTATFLRASEAKNLGTASILAAGTFNAIANADWQLDNVVTGAGTVLKTGSAVLTVDQSLASFTGLTDVQAGMLVVGNDTMTGSLVGGKANVAAGATLTGNGKIAGDVTNAGTIAALNALPAYARAAAGNFTIGGVLTNSGTVQLGGATVGNTITVGGIIGQGGTFVLNTVLGDDSSKTDKIIVNGGSVTGSNFITIVNQGGLGAQTTGNGIQVVVTQNGATTATDSFALMGRAAAGAYEYDLVRGERSGSGEDWFLRTPDPVTPVTPVTPSTGLRPEIPTNAAIMPLASEFGYAMLGTLHERTGGAFVTAKALYEERTVWCKDAAQNFRCTVRTPVDLGPDSQNWMAGGWARIFADRGLRGEGNFARHGSDYDYTLGGAQAGLDIYAREGANGSLDKAGVYVGYGQVEADIKGINGGKAGTVDMNGYSVGAYWTHYAATGWYTDAVVQGTWYNADARSIKGEQVKPDGFGVMASLEGGYSFKLGSGWSVEPQAQVIYQTLSFDNTQDHFGTFAFQDNDSVRARVGTRVARTWNNGTEQAPRMITAWARANVWHEFGDKYQMTTATFANTSPFLSNTSLGGTWGEIGAGVTAQVSEKVNLFATGAYEHSIDGKDRQGWNGRLGATVKW